MLEYVRWCSSLDDLASCNCSNVRLSTCRYSEKKLPSMPFFFAVSGKQLIRTVFLKVFSPILYRCLEYIKVKEVKHNSSHD